MILLNIFLNGIIKTVRKTISLDESIGEVEDVIVKEEIPAIRKMVISDSTVEYFLKTPITTKMSQHAWLALSKTDRLNKWFSTYGDRIKWEIID